MLKKFAMEDCKSVETPIGHGVQLRKEYGASKVYKMTYKIIVGSLHYHICVKFWVFSRLHSSY